MSTCISHTEGELLYGRQPVIETLRAKRRTIYELHILATAKPSLELNNILAECRKKKVTVKKVHRKQLDDMTSGANHQGIALLVSKYPYLTIDDLISYLRKRNHAPLLLMLDHIEDPQNLGSLLRAADAAGVDAVVLPDKRAAGITPAAVRASAGAAEHVKACLVTGFISAMTALKNEGIRFVCLESRDDAVIYSDSDLTGPLGLVVGSEGKGLTREAIENSDVLLKIPMCGEVSSLNAAQAGAITLFEIQRQRRITGN